MRVSDKDTWKDVLYIGMGMTVALVILLMVCCVAILFLR